MHSKQNESGKSSDKGFLRTTLAGEGHTLTEAFSKLRESPLVTSVVEHPGRKLLGARMLLDPSEGSGYWDFYQLGNDVYIVLCEFVYNQSHEEGIPGEGLLEFHIKLSGSLSLELSRSAPLQVDGPSLLIWNQPEGYDSSVSKDQGAYDKSLSLYCNPSFLLSDIIFDQSKIPSQLVILTDSADQGINYCKVPLSLEIVEAAEKLFEVPHDDPFSLIYVESKVLELFYLIITSLDSLSSQADESYSTDELQRFHQAQQILLENYCPPATISQIARQIGIGESKLRQGFKSVFGMTIFEYGTQCRMQHALKLLQETDKQLGYISESLGYEHQTTFTAAFKRYFGFLPKDVRKFQK